MRKRIAPEMTRGFGTENICPRTSFPMSFDSFCLVTMIAEEIERRSEGIWATRPSPMVSFE